MKRIALLLLLIARVVFADAGSTTLSFTAGEDIDSGEAIALYPTDGKYYKVGTNSDNWEAIALADTATDETGYAVTSGVASVTSPVAFGLRDPVYIDTSNGALTDDSTTGELVGYSLSDTGVGETLVVMVGNISETARDSISPAQITSNQNNYSPPGLATASEMHLTSDASRNITGLATGTSGRVLVLYNDGSFNIVLKHGSGLSDPENRFNFSTGADITLEPDDSLTIMYNKPGTKWKLYTGGSIVSGSTAVAIGDTITSGSDNHVLFVNPATVLDEDSGLTYVDTTDILSVGEGVVTERFMTEAADVADAVTGLNCGSGEVCIAGESDPTGTDGTLSFLDDEAWHFDVDASAGVMVVIGGPDEANPEAKQIRIGENTLVGTSNTAGGTAIIKGSLGTGNATPSAMSLQIANAVGSGTTQQVYGNGLVLQEAGSTIYTPFLLNSATAYFGTNSGDLADSGMLRAANNAAIACAETATPGNDSCMSTTSSDEWQWSVGGNYMFKFNATTAKFAVPAVAPDIDGGSHLGTSSLGWGNAYIETSIQDIEITGLTDDTNKSFVTLTCAAGDTTSGEVEYVIFAENGTTESQALVGTLRYSCLNLAGTEVCATPIEVGTELHNETTGGTADMTSTWACIDAGVNAISLQVQANTGIGSPTLIQIRWRVHVNSGTSTITPLS